MDWGMGMSVIWLTLWTMLWIVAGHSAGDRRGQANKGALLGLFLGPIGVLFALSLADKSRKCPYCLSRVPNGAVVCARCGRSLAPRPVSAAPAPRTVQALDGTIPCPNCAHPIAEDSIVIGNNICPRCNGVFTAQ